MAAGVDDDSFRNASSRFIDWLSDNGTTISSKVQLADLRHRSAGRGVIAVDDIAEDEELFSIPRQSILTAETSGLSVDVTIGIEDPWLSLILAMAFESQLGSVSKWAPYFKVLPDEFDTLMYWTNGELEWLQGSTVIDKIGRKSADRTFTDQLIPVVRSHEDTFKANDLADTDLLAMFHRMGSIIMAYAFDLEDSAQRPNTPEDGWEEDSDGGLTLPKGIVPLADMLNADADRNNARLFYEDDNVVMKSIKAVKRGEELFNDYGPLPRADVLRRYGYVTDEYAKYDLVEISLDLIKRTATQAGHLRSDDVVPRVEYLEEQGVAEDGYDISRADDDQEAFPEALVILLNGLTLTSADFDKLKKKDKLPKAELSGDAATLLHSVLRARLLDYPDRVSEGLGNERRRNMAASVIEGEKQVLHEAICALDDLIGNQSVRRTADAAADDDGHQGKRQRIA